MSEKPSSIFAQHFEMLTQHGTLTPATDKSYIRNIADTIKRSKSLSIGGSVTQIINRISDVNRFQTRDGRQFVIFRDIKAECLLGLPLSHQEKLIAEVLDDSHEILSYEGNRDPNYQNPNEI